MLAIFLTALVGQSPAADPHPARTLFRGPLVRLLDDPRVADWLALPSARRDALQAALAKIDARQDTAFRSDWTDRQRRLRGEAQARHREFAWAADAALGAADAARLAGLAYRHWGPKAAFAVGVAERIGISERQRQAFLALLHRQSAPRLPGQAEAAKPTTVAEILTAEQRQTLEALLGAPPGFALDLYVEAEDDRPSPGLAGDVPPLLEPQRPQRLLALDDVQAALRWPVAVRNATQRQAKAALAAERAALEPLAPHEPAAPRLARAAAAEAAFAKELDAALAPDQQRRFAELRRQLLGFGGAFGVEGQRELGLGADDVRKAFEAASDAVAKAAAGDRELDQRTAQAKCDEVLKGLLSESQRRRWRELCGAPFDAAALARARRAAERPEKETSP